MKFNHSPICVSLLSLAFLAIVVNQSACKEFGPEKSYGADGRLFSSSPDEYFLLWQRGQCAQGGCQEDGEIRIKKKYDGGAFEEKREHFLVSCPGDYDFLEGPFSVQLSETEDFDKSPAIEVANPKQFPESAKKYAYNLYWAACQGQFRKFK